MNPQDVGKKEKTDNPSDASAAQVLLDLEALIKTHITAIDKAKADLKKQREMLTSILENDETYRRYNEEAKKSAKTKAQTKFQLMQQSQNKALAEKIRSIAAEVRGQDAALSDYLREYQRISGASEIETDDGVVCEIVYVAKLVRKSPKSNG